VTRFEAVVELERRAVEAFVPGMLAHGEAGHVVNRSSGNGGLIVLPTTPIYATSKSAVSTLTEALHFQLTGRGAKITRVVRSSDVAARLLEPSTVPCGDRPPS
jgi:short-subunit dehydrogenase